MNEEVQILSDQHRKIQSEGFLIPSKDDDAVGGPPDLVAVSDKNDVVDEDMSYNEPNISVFTSGDDGSLMSSTEQSVSNDEARSGMYFVLLWRWCVFILPSRHTSSEQRYYDVVLVF